MGIRRVVIFVILFGCSNASNAVPIQWSSGVGGNDHYYDVVLASGGISWTDSNSAALASGGYLATLTSSAENDFVFGLVDDPMFWNKGNSASNLGPWLGGFQSVTTGGAGNNWEWVNGEGPITFFNWAPGEPNDFLSLDEDFLHYKCLGFCRANTWNDLPDTAAQNADNEPVIAYVVEFDSLMSVPEPTLFSLFAVGLVAGRVCSHARKS